MKKIALCCLLALIGTYANLSPASPMSYNVSLVFTDDTSFTGTFDYDSASQTVSNLRGTLDDVLMGNVEAIDYQLIAENDGRGGITAYAFAMNTTRIGTNPPVNNNVGVAINFNAANPTLGPTNPAQLAYMDCSAFALMGQTCMYYLSWHNPVIPMEGGHGILAETITANGGNMSSDYARYDCLFNWAEINYAHLFSPSGSASHIENPYYYRYYPSSNAYVGVSLVDKHVYYLGPDRVMEDVGLSSAWLGNVGC